MIRPALISITWVPINNELFDGISGGLNDGLSDGLSDGLNERQKTVLKEIINKPGIKGKDLSDKLNIPVDTIDRYIRIFVSKNLVERRGSKKTGGYFVIK